MHPVLFTVGNFAVPSYGVLMGAGMFLGLLLGTRRAKLDGLPADWMWDLGLLAMVFGVVGARLEFVRTHWEDFAGDPMRIFALREGGLVFYGGFLTVLASYRVYAWWRKTRSLALYDALAPSVGLGLGMGRLGCLAAGCCYGKPTDSWWHLTFPEGSIAPAGVKLIPTQLHEAGFAFALMAFLWWFPRRFVGQRFAILLGAYAIFRAINETLRGDAARGTVLESGLSNGQVTSLAVLVTAVLIWLRASNNPTPRSPPPP